MEGYDQPCRVHGTVRAGGRELQLDALGQRGHSWGDPDWERIELARTVTAWTDRRLRRADRDPAATARRPTPTRPSGRRCGSPRRCVEIADAAALDDLRRRRPHAPRRSGAVAVRRARAGRAAAPARCCAARRSSSARCSWTARSSAGTWRAAPASGATTSSAAPRRVIRAVVSDFGGVLTAPLLDGFARVQDDTGVPLEAFGSAIAAPRPPTAATRCTRLEVGAISEDEFLAMLERELEPGSAGRSRCTASASATWRGSTPTPRCSPATATLHARGVRCAHAHEQRARVGAAVADQAAGRRDLRDRRRLRRSSACASPIRRSTRSCSSGSGCPRRRACSSTTSSANVEAARELGFAVMHHVDTDAAIARARRS